MKRNLTVINVTELAFFDYPGGVGRLADDLCRRQVEWGYRVFLVAWKTEPSLPDREEREGITVLRVEGKEYSPPDPRNLIEKIRAHRRAALEILSEVGHVDVIHSHSPMQGLGAMGAASKTTALKVHSIHSPWVEEMRASKAWENDGSLKRSLGSKAALATARRLESNCLGLADFVTSDSHYTHGEITRMYERVMRNKRFEVFHGWVDTERFTPEGPCTNWEPETGREPKGPVFFTVRALIPRNGLEMLIDAAASVRDRDHDFELVIGGDGPLKENLQQKIQSLALNNRVKLIGRIDDGRLPVLYRSCDMFVLPTIALECFGIIILEALASGKPVIATPVGAIPELLSPIYPEGLLPEVSSSALAEAMIKFLEEFKKGNHIENYCGRFRQYVCDNYSTDIGTGRFRKIYESCPVT
jgi:glycosyltransferase involved in cell wall biosynthesis